MIIKIAVILVFLLEVFNIISYAFFRIDHKGRANLHSYGKNEKKMTYFIPGYRQNAKDAFKFLQRTGIKSADPIIGGITYVEYSNWGFDPKVIASQIINDIKRYNYEPTLICVSVGDQIARYVEREIKDVKIVAINPATNDECLNYANQVIMRIEMPFINLAVMLFGWIAHLRIIKTDTGRKKSLSLYTDQMNCLIYSRLEVEGDATRYLILSKYDNLLENKDVRDIFHKVPDDNIAIVSTTHANTAVGGKLYRDKMLSFLATMY